MELSKIKVGKTYSYTSRTHSGRAKVVGIWQGGSGCFVRMFDKERKLPAKEDGGVIFNVSVRPSQVTA